MTVSAQLQEFIVSEITPGRGIDAIGPEDDLLARGIVDSLGVTMLVDFVEERFGVRVSDEDLVPANFQNVACIEALIARKQAA